MTAVLAADQQAAPRPAPAAARAPCPPGGGGDCCAECGPLVDDGASPASGQMRAGEFLDRLRTELLAALETELAAVGMTAADCPYVDYWIERYRGRPGTEVTALVRRFASPAAQTPAAMIAAVRTRVLQGARAYREKMAGVAPSTAPTKLRPGAGTGTGEVPTRRDALGLGAGEPIDGGTRSRLESAFGTGLGDVRVHGDGPANELSDRFGARAVAVGDHIAFAEGELSRPGLGRDVLVAHEVAHTLQQRGSAGGDAGRPVSPDVERDADRSAALVAARLLLGEQAAVEPRPRLRSALGLGRCAAAAVPAIGAAAGTGAGAGAGIGLGTIVGALGLGAILTLESDTPRVKEEEVPRTCETVYPGMPECWALPDEYVFTSPDAALAAMKKATGDPSLSLHSPSPTTSGPCPGLGVHYNVRAGGTRAGSITCCPCCSDDAGGPVVMTRCRIVW